MGEITFIGVAAKVRTWRPPFSLLVHLMISGFLLAQYSSSNIIFKLGITINEPVVYMARDVMILMRASPFRGPLEGVWSMKIETFLALEGTVA